MKRGDLWFLLALLGGVALYWYTRRQAAAPVRLTVEPAASPGYTLYDETGAVLPAGYWRDLIR